MLKSVLPPVFAALILGVVAAVCVWLQQPLLAPSLGAAVLSQTLHAGETSSQPYNLAVGQLVGVLAGFIGVYVAGQSVAPALVGSHALPAGRIAAVAIAALVASALQILVRAKTPTGGATALVLALGIEAPTWIGAGRMVAGIAIVMVLGDAARHIILRLEKAG